MRVCLLAFGVTIGAVISSSIGTFSSASAITDSAIASSGPISAPPAISNGRSALLLEPNAYLDGFASEEVFTLTVVAGELVYSEELWTAQSPLAERLGFELDTLDDRRDD